MKKNKVDLHAQSVEELKKTLAEKRKELLTSRLDHVRGKLKNGSSLSNIRRHIAQVATVIREKELKSYGKNA